MSHWIFRALVVALNAVEGRLTRWPALYKVLLAGPLGGLRWRLGAWRAWVNFERAYRDVPAYRSFVDARGGPPRLRVHAGVPDLTLLPEIDKATYVQRYDQAARCVGGSLPAFGVVVDESSGSSGTPTSWVRGPEERAVTKAMLQLSFRSALGSESLFVINAFALGAWATGLNVTQSLSDICVIKSTGPDLDKIVHTLEEFGPGHEYVVAGYPPFLKALCDDDRIDWTAYRVRAIFGGEGISESMRDYLLESFRDVKGSYGASDLEINLAAESAFTVALRRAMRHDASLRDRLTQGRPGPLPMVLQYNPLAYVFETNAAGELLVTLARPANVAPKIRYNIHDLGHAVRFEEVAAVLRELGQGELIDANRPVALPLLFLYGRSDQSIDYYGANVTPDSVHEILFQVAALAPHLESFRLISTEDDRRDKIMEIAVELNERCEPAELDHDALARQIFRRLADVNADFRNAYDNTAPAGGLPRLSLHAKGTGPFVEADGIKHRYVAADGAVAAEVACGAGRG